MLVLDEVSHGIDDEGVYIATFASRYASETAVAAVRYHCCSLVDSTELTSAYVHEVVPPGNSTELEWKVYMCTTLLCEIAEMEMDEELDEELEPEAEVEVAAEEEEEDEDKSGGEEEVSQPNKNNTGTTAATAAQLRPSDRWPSRRKSRHLMRQVRSMFGHAFDSYMANAFPLDELKPLACEGENFEPTAGTMLTLIDSLDTLALLGNVTAFHAGVNREGEF